MKKDLIDNFPPQIRLNELQINSQEEISINDNQSSWLQGILTKAHETFEENLAILEKTPSLLVNLKFTRKVNPTYGEHILAEGQISGHVLTNCIKCLIPMTLDIEVPFNVCFLDESLEKTPEYENLISIFYDGQDRDLYYYNKNIIPFDNLISEQLHLNICQYPLHSEDCKGLDPVSGKNLNVEKN